jgi:hypothetical protein
VKDARCLLSFHAWTVRRQRDATGQDAQFMVCRRCGRTRDPVDGMRSFGSGSILGG